MALAIVGLAFSAGCKESSGGSSGGSSDGKERTPVEAAAGGSAAASSGAPSAGKQVDLLPEMKSFIDGFGSRAKLSEALREHGAPDLDAGDMAAHDLTEPRVLKAELYGAKLCYTLEAKAGAVTRAYLVCWDKDKIVSIESRGTR